MLREPEMKRFVPGEDRKQQMLLPNNLEDHVAEESQMRVIEVFIEILAWRAWASPA